jgi:hypothetical protein
MLGEVENPHLLVRELVEDRPGVVAAAVVYDDDLTSPSFKAGITIDARQEPSRNRAKGEASSRGSCESPRRYPGSALSRCQSDGSVAVADLSDRITRVRVVVR